MITKGDRRTGGDAARDVLADLRSRGVVVSAWPTEPGRMGR